MNWTQLNATLLNLAVTNSLDVNFATELPDIINYAENRIYRDLDFLQTRQSQTTTMTANSPVVSMANLVLPVIVLETVTVYTPVSFLHHGNPLTRQSKPFMDIMYSDAFVAPTGTSIPADYYMIDEQTISVGPTPDQAYNITFFGTIRPAQISASNPTTWLCSNLPELYVTACMVRIAGYQKNYAGATSDDPNQPVSWETQYATLLRGAGVEEARRKAQSASWSDQMPIPQSTPPRA